MAETKLAANGCLEAYIRKFSSISAEMRTLDLRYEYQQVQIFLRWLPEHLWSKLTIKCELDANFPSSFKGQFVIVAKEAHMMGLRGRSDKQMNEAIGTPQEGETARETGEVNLPAVDLSQAVEDMTARMVTMVLGQQAHSAEEMCRIIMGTRAGIGVNVRQQQTYGGPPRNAPTGPAAGIRGPRAPAPLYIRGDQLYLNQELEKCLAWDGIGY